MEIQASLTNNESISKITFLQCYQSARQKALSKAHIERGFRAAGIWPRNHAVALNSSQVVIGRQTPPPGRIQPDLTYLSPFMGFSTPRRPRDVFDIQSSIRKCGISADNSTTRAVFQKLARALENKEVELATTSQELAGIRGLLQKTKPIKHSKVKPEPNKRFVDIPAIQRVRERAERHQALLQPIDGDCIIVRAPKLRRNKRN